MNIIGGKLKGKKLLGPKGYFIRPAMALTRKSIFDTLQNIIDNASVLDLYAGTGIVGIEALSRGAKELILVDANKDSICLIYKNLNLCNVKAKVVLGRLPKVLEAGIFKDKQFDIIFIDPPYGKEEQIERILELIDKNKLIKSGGVISIESEMKAQFNLPKDLKLYKEKKLGNTKITILNS